MTELDPHLVTGVAEGNVLRALFEGLVAEDPVDLHPVPGVAVRLPNEGEVVEDSDAFTPNMSHSVPG